MEDNIMNNRVVNNIIVARNKKLIAINSISIITNLVIIEEIVYSQIGNLPNYLILIGHDSYYSN